MSTFLLVTNFQFKCSQKIQLFEYFNCSVSVQSDFTAFPLQINFGNESYSNQSNFFFLNYLNFITYLELLKITIKYNTFIA